MLTNTSALDMLPPFFLRCYLCLSPVLLRLAYASEPSSLLTKEYVLHTQANLHLHTRTLHVSMLRVRIHYARHTKIMLAEIVYDTKEVSKCVFKRTLYLDSFPLRLRSVHSLRTHEIVFVG